MRELAAILLLAVACSSCSPGDDGGSASSQEAVALAPLEDGEPAPHGFAGTVATATSAAGELELEQDLAIGGELLAEATGVVDLAAEVARLDLVVHGPDGDTRIEQVLEAGRLTERHLDRPGAQPEEVDSSGGGPLLLPDAETVEDASDLADALRQALALAPLVGDDPDDRPDGTTCWVGDVAGSSPQRVEVCVDGADILRRLRTTSVSSAGLVGTTTLTLSPRP